MGSLLIQYKNVTSRPPSPSLVLFLSLNTHFSSIFPSPNLSPFRSFFPDYADLELVCVRVSNLLFDFAHRQEWICLDKDGCSERATEGFRLPWSPSLSLSVSFSFSVFVDEMGVIHFLTWYWEKRTKKPHFSVVKRIWTTCMWKATNKYKHRTWKYLSNYVIIWGSLI